MAFHTEMGMRLYDIKVSPIARIQISLIGDEVQIVFVNGIIESVSYSMELSDVSGEADQAGQRALELLRGKGRMY